MGKGYELKAKVTRIFVADYLLLKQLSIEAGVSMAEALHNLITGQLKPKQKQITIPHTRIPMLTFQVTPQPVMAISGNSRKANVFLIKPKGGVLHGR